MGSSATRWREFSVAVLPLFCCILGLSNAAQQNDTLGTPYLLVAFYGHIDRLYMNGTLSHTICFEPLNSIEAIDYHYRMQHVYWIVTHGKIRRARLNGTAEQTPEDVTSTNGVDLAVDWIEDKLYWTVNDNTIHVLDISSIDSSKGRRVYVIEVVLEPSMQFTSIILDPINRTMYLLDVLSDQIRVINYTGELIRSVPKQHEVQICCPALSFKHDLIFWFGGRHGEMHAQGLKNTSLMRSYTMDDISLITEIEYFRGRIYWLQKSLSIGIYYRRWERDDSDAIEIQSYSNNQVVRDFTLVDPSKQPLISDDFAADLSENEQSTSSSLSSVSLSANTPVLSIPHNSISPTLTTRVLSTPTTHPTSMAQVTTQTSANLMSIVTTSTTVDLTASSMATQQSTRLNVPVTMVGSSALKTSGSSLGRTTHASISHTPPQPTPIGVSSSHILTNSQSQMIESSLQTTSHSSSYSSSPSLNSLTTTTSAVNPMLTTTPRATIVPTTSGSTSSLDSLHPAAISGIFTHTTTTSGAVTGSFKIKHKETVRESSQYSQLPTTAASADAPLTTPATVQLSQVEHHGSDTVSSSVNMLPSGVPAIPHNDGVVNTTLEAIAITATCLSIAVLIFVGLAILDAIYYFSYERKVGKTASTGLLGAMWKLTTLPFHCISIPRYAFRKRRRPKHPYIPRCMNISDISSSTTSSTDNSGTLSDNLTDLSILSGDDGSGNSEIPAHSATMGSNIHQDYRDVPQPEVTQLELETKAVLEFEFEKDDLL